MRFAVPTVHLNGTSKAELVKQLRDAAKAIRAAKDALALAAPHGRDYYVQADPDALGNATRQYEARQAKLTDVHIELIDIATEIQKQGKE